VQVTGHNSSWVSPFGHPRINARLPTPQGISQAPTSFIGSRCQGIHHAPLPTCHTNHQHTQQTHPRGLAPVDPQRGARCLPVVNSSCKMIKTQNDIQHYKQEHTRTRTTRPPQTPQPKQQPGDHDVCIARVHYPIIKQPEAQPAPERSPRPPASDASDTQQRAMLSTRLPKGRRRVPLANTPNAPTRTVDVVGCAP
jgi:hypothetical protein